MSMTSAGIYYEVRGSGPALILIHAMSAGHEMWRRQVGALSIRHRVITFDAHGAGRSADLTRRPGARTQWADDIAQILDDLGERDAVVCGVSFGGIVAQHFAQRYPGRVRGLVIVDSYSDSRPLGPSRALWLAGVYGGSVANFLPRPVLKRIVLASYTRWPEAADVLSRSMDALRPWQAFRSRNAINLVNYLPSIEAHDYPVAFVLGTDSWWRSKAFAREFHAAVPRSTLIEIADSNDPTPLCQPQRFNAVLAEFLRDLS